MVNALTLKPFRRSAACLLGASIAAMAVAVSAAPVVMSGQEAFELAVKLVGDEAYDEADAILRTLAKGDPETIDMMAVDRLAAKIAFKTGDNRRALKILKSVIDASPEDWRARYDLAHVAMAARRDRLADAQLTTLLGMDIDDAVKKKVRSDRAMLADRRVLRLSMRASAAPSTNINNATRADTFNYGGVVPLALSDDARARSGVGVNWTVGGLLTPSLTSSVKGHLSVSGNLVDHSNAAFDQTSTTLEAGFRHRMARPRGLQTTLVGTHSLTRFGGEAYSNATGARLSARSVLSNRTAMSFSLSVQDVAYKARSDRNGVVVSVSAGVQHFLSRWMQASAHFGFARENAVAETEANSRSTLSLGLFSAGPLGTRLGVQPSVYFRAFDATSAAYGVKREDVTADVSFSLGHRRIQWSGFAPSLVYRYTDNNSTVDLFSYDRHAIDIAFARGF